MVTLIFGDSIAWGAFDLEGGGWADKLKRDGFKNENFVYNLAVSGDTSYDVFHRIHDEIYNRADQDDDLRIIIAVGINDASRINGKLRTAEHDFTYCINGIIQTCKIFTKDIWFVGLTGVNQLKSQPVSWDERLTYSNNDIDQYNKLLNETVEKYLPSRFIEIDPISTLHSVDGVHLSRDQHQGIYNTINAAINEPE